MDYHSHDRERGTERYLKEKIDQTQWLNICTEQERWGWNPDG